MADISILTRLIAGIHRDVDLQSNSLVVGSLKVGATSPAELTKTILTNLIALQNGSDFANGTNAHTHDGRYYTETEIGSTTGGSSGAKKVGVSGTPTNHTPATADVQAYLDSIDSALASAGGTSFFDNAFEIKDNGDATKKLTFQVSGISTSTTRTITMPDANVDLTDVNNAILKDGSRTYTSNQPMGSNKLTGLSAGSSAGDSVRYEQAILASGANAFAAAQSMGGFKLTNVADPSASQDAVTLSYFNARLNGLTPKAPVYVATTVDITLSGNQTIDTVSVTAGKRVLVKNQTLPEENGIYVSSASAWSRATDMDDVTPIDEVNGAWVTIQQGSQAGQVFVQYGIVTTVDTDAINFQFYNPIAGLIGGDMITFAGSAFSVDLATVSGLESSNSGNVAGQLRIKLEASNPSLKITGSNELGVKLDSAGAITSGASGLIVGVDGSTVEINSNALRVKDSGITLSKLASNSVDENKIVSTTFSATGAVTGGGGTKVAVQVDGSSIEINSNALRVKTTAYDQSTITGGGGSAASVASAPSSKRTLVAGESFAADTSFAVRFALTGETAGRVYKADKDASSSSKYMAIGIARSVAGVSAGGNIEVVMLGEASQGANDSAYASGDVGKELYVGTSGALILGSALTGTGTEAAFCIGVIQTTTKVWVDFKNLRGISA